MSDYTDLLAAAEQELIKWINENKPVDEDDLSEAIFEITDSHVPVYNGTLLALATDNIELATVEPECYGFNGTHTAINAIAGVVFEEITNTLWEVWDKYKESDKE